MKKIVLLLGMLLIANTSAIATCKYNCVAPYDMNNKFRSFVGAVSGVNFTAEKVGQKVVKKAFNKVATNDDLKVKLDSYSAKDLKNGIFKSLSVEGQNVNINDIYLSYLKLDTLCKFNYIKQVDNEVVFMEDFPMSFDIRMTASDINKTMQSEKYQRIINDLNKLGNSIGGLKIASTKVAVKSSKFYYIIGIAIPFIRTEQKIVINSDLVVKKGKIDFANTKLVSDAFSIDLKKIDFILNYLNPLDFSVNILDNKEAKVSVDSVSVQNSVIHTKGIVIIPKD